VMPCRGCCTLVFACRCLLTCVMTFGGGCRVQPPTMVWFRWRLRASRTICSLMRVCPQCLALGCSVLVAFLSLDACQLRAMGFDPPADTDNINVWECFAVLVAVLCFGDCWQRLRVLVFRDNAATVSWVSKGAPRPPAARVLVRRLFDVCLRLHVRLCISHNAGVQNVLADTLSRRQWSQFGAAAASALGVDSPFLCDVLPSRPPLQASP
jgi:hypothetical protein